MILDDVDHADVLNPILREKGIKSLLGVPLLLGGEAIGVLHVGSLTPRLFTADESELLQLVAERVAIAIERAACTRRRCSSTSCGSTSSRSPRTSCGHPPPRSTACWRR